MRCLKGTNKGDAGNAGCAGGGCGGGGVGVKVIYSNLLKNQLVFLAFLSGKT